MGGIFGKQKQPVRISWQDEVILGLKQQRDKLKQYQKRLELSLEQDRLLARKCLQTGRKDRARMLLRKRKYQENLIITVDGQLENIEKMTADLEFAEIEKQVFEGLTVGNVALAKVHAIMSVESVEQLLDETREGVDKQKQIDALLVGVLTDDDEEDVMAELDRLVELDAAEEAAAKRPAAAAGEADADLAARLPDVPTDELREARKTKAAAKTAADRIALQAS